MIDRLRYDGKRVIVTGAASGIGRATAEALVDLGAEVIAMDIQECDVGARFIHVDMTDKASIEAAAAQAGGPVHGLFASAGVGSTAPFKVALMCNFVGMRHLIDKTVPAMPAGSAIVIVSSTGGSDWAEHVEEVRPLVESDGFDSGQAWVEAHGDDVGYAYAFSKRAVRLYTVLKAAQLAPLGIRVNTVSPHGTITPMWHKFYDVASDEIRSIMTGLEGKKGDPEDQAFAMAYINSDAATHVNGTDLAVDGGFLVKHKSQSGDAALPPLAS